MVLDLNFTADKVETDVQSLNCFLGVPHNIDIDYGNSDSTVEYELQPEARNWGLKYIAVIVTKVHCLIEWSCYIEDLSEDETDKLIKAGGILMNNKTIEGSIEIDSTKKLNGKEWNIESDELRFREDGALQIDNVTIDFDYTYYTIAVS